MSTFSDIRRVAEVTRQSRRGVVSGIRDDRRAERAGTFGEAVFIALSRSAWTAELSELGLPGWPGCSCSCDCGEAATGIDDDGGVPVCSACADYTVTDDGEAICSRETDAFERCHACGQEIEWGRIETGPPGSPNTRYGSCDCGDAWSQADCGGTWVTGYSSPDAEEDL